MSGVAPAAAVMASGLRSSIFCPIKPPNPSSPFTGNASRTLTVTSSGAPSAPGRRGSPAGGGGGRSRAPGREPRKRSAYGTSRRSILKKTFSQEQVVFTAPVADDPAVGIIGGGISGLVCAVTLEQRGIRSTVFDTVSSEFVILSNLLSIRLDLLHAPLVKFVAGSSLKMERNGLMIR